MKIWHVVSGELSPQKVCGVNNTVWLVAWEQAILGHQVALVLDVPPESASFALAEQAGFELHYIPGNTWRYDPNLLDPLLDSAPPQIAHMHSVFIPKQASFANNLVRRKIPYVITPNAMAPELLRRGWLKKFLYSLFVEKPRFSAAAAIAVVTPKEEEAVRAFVPRYSGNIRWVPNPVDSHNLDAHQWKGNIEAKRVVYLGRFDVLHKGIDILVETARYLPELEFHLYGSEDAKTKEWLEQLKSNLPANVYFHSPVFGSEKAEVLTGASLYIQTSRWEVFGISIAEAMYLGVPCALTDTLNMSAIFRQSDLGLVLPQTPKQAASCIKEVFAQSARLLEWSDRSRAFAREHFQPRTVASEYLKLYEEVTHP